MSPPAEAEAASNADLGEQRASSPLAEQDGDAVTHDLDASALPVLSKTTQRAPTAAMFDLLEDLKQPLKPGEAAAAINDEEVAAADVGDDAEVSST